MPSMAAISGTVIGWPSTRWRSGGLTADHPFTGVFNGNGFTIKLHYSDSSEYTLTNDELLTEVRYYVDGNVVTDPENFKFTTTGVKTITVKYAADETVNCDLQVTVVNASQPEPNNNGSSGGCGSFIGTELVVLPVVMLAGAVIAIKKRKD